MANTTHVYLYFHFSLQWWKQVAQLVQRNRATHASFVFYSNYGRISYCLWDMDDYWSDFAHLHSPPPVWFHHWGWSHQNFVCSTVSTKKGWVTFSANSRGFPNHWWRLKGRAIALSCDIKISAVCSFVLSASTRVTRQTESRLPTMITKITKSQKDHK